tara:strand:+ start:309 stop:965 length:657 start_codon:yes stop_codon:yes gene_type:complete
MKSEEIQKADWVVNHSNLPFILLNKKFPFEEILEEVKNLNFYPYNEGHSKGWSCVALYGYSDSKTSIYHHSKYNLKNPKTDFTEIAAHCPITTKYFLNSKCFKKYNRIRFMKIGPKGYIKKHNDFPTWKDSKNRISESSLTSYHFVLTNPEKCKFIVEDYGNIPLKPGDVFLFCNAFDHHLRNDSNEDRIHILIHGEIDMKYWCNYINHYYWNSKKYI